MLLMIRMTIVYAFWRKTQKYIKLDFLDVFVAIWISRFYGRNCALVLFGGQYPYNKNKNWKIFLTLGWNMFLFSIVHHRHMTVCTSEYPANHSILHQSSETHHPHIRL